jgi:hypothetical protein
LDLYGDKKFLDQFWLHFKKSNPNLLTTIHKSDLPVYFEALKEK